MDALRLHAVAAFAAGLIITLFLAAYLTPRGWWRRPNARALFIMVAGAWGFGSLILYAAHAAASGGDHLAQASPGTSPAGPPPPQAALPAGAVGGGTLAPGDIAGSAAATAGRAFRVHRDLNLRAAPGVHAARVGVVPAGAIVTPTGVHDGDWWQIKATIGHSEQTGWASSLWLRRSGE
ncbi:SH3 domain-containing protein [Duganella radicis]|uniref:SH3 domain-containing protein n=1 Tax=Duganella radicis TaxID=551988 RepID=A0A6L6PL65_9BURK|nr:SH3 domain-containing protein [Duganella radicis]MTV39868.1 SH3 domain-containing protein [Duganella radicis]